MLARCSGLQRLGLYGNMICGGLQVSTLELPSVASQLRASNPSHLEGDSEGLRVLGPTQLTVAREPAKDERSGSGGC